MRRTIRRVEYTGNNMTKEIVRCRDCVFAFKEDNGMYSCNGDLTELWDYYNDCPVDVLVPADGFCFCGKRRENND